MLEETTSRPVSIDDLKAAIARAPVGSVPGPTGLSYAMMKTWSDKVLKEAFEATAMIWEKSKYPTGGREQLCPKSNTDPSATTPDDLRPLCLLETTKKIWMGIIVGRIVNAWDDEKVLASGQYGFLQGRGREGLTIQVINALEEAEEVGTEIHGSSWDIRRAFDSIRKPILHPEASTFSSSQTLTIRLTRIPIQIFLNVSNSQSGRRSSSVAVLGSVLALGDSHFLFRQLGIWPVSHIIVTTSKAALRTLSDQVFIMA